MRRSVTRIVLYPMNGDEVDRPGWNVVDEVVPVGVGHGAERGAYDSYLRVRDRRARLVAHPAFEFTSRLGVERGRAHDQGDCRQRDAPRCAGEGAHTTLLHGHVLQRCDTCLPLTRNIAKALIASRLPSTRVPDEQRLLLPLEELRAQNGCECEKFRNADLGPVGRERI